MTRFTIEIDTDNAAFGETDMERDDEIRRIINEIVLPRLRRNDAQDVRLYDENGNDVGRAWFRQAGTDA